VDYRVRRAELATMVAAMTITTPVTPNASHLSHRISESYTSAGKSLPYSQRRYDDSDSHNPTNWRGQVAIPYAPSAACATGVHGDATDA